MINLTLRPERVYQTMEGFGASGAWWAQLVGGWPDALRCEILRLLYDKTHGLGMGIYRYNLGGGSKESGKGRYSEPLRRASSFLDDEGNYDWNRDAQALWCMREAVRWGADEVVLFVNSPPERWTVSGMAQAKLPFRANLRRDCEAKFVRYVLDVAEHLIAEGLPVKFISPVNEPFGFWIETAGQEGCHYHPAGLRRLLRRFALEMEQRPALQGVRLSGAENNDLRLMNKTYARAVLNDPVIRSRLDGIDVHGYAFGPLRFLKGGAVKRRFRRYMDRHYPGVPIRMSEWTHMQGGRDYGMDSALEQAKVMWEDLRLLNAVSWQHWIAVSEVEFCDGLIYIDQEACTFDIPKRYYAFGNFTKFIPRGARRIGIDGVPGSLLALAFDCGAHMAVILINPGEAAQTLSLGSGPAELYETNAEQNLACRGISLEEVTLTARSVNTILIET